MGNLILEKFFSKKKESIAKPQISDFFKLSALDIQGNLVEFQTLKKYKAILIVNVASQCGLTKTHYQQLCQIHSQLKDQQFQILAFPCNQFMNQESLCERDIEKYVKSKFAAEFMLFSKVKVNGDEAHPVYKYLRTNSSLYDPVTGLTQEVPFNFSKFLVDDQGLVRGFYPPTIEPNQLIPTIKQLLKD